MNMVRTNSQIFRNSPFVGTLVAMMIFMGCADEKVVIKEASTVLDPEVPERYKQAPAADPMIAQQWNMARVSSQNDVTGQDGRKSVVAILSSGVDYLHEDLRNNILINSSEAQFKKPGQKNYRDGLDDDQNGYVDDVVGYDFIENDGYPFDRNGAGTAIAGLIAASSNNGLGIRSIAPDSKILPVRYLDENGVGKVIHLAQAIEYAAAMKVDIVVVHLSNISYGQFARNSNKAAAIQLEKTVLAAAIQKLRVLKIPVVISAGNQGADLSASKDVIQSLASLENAVIVTSVDENDKRPFVSNYGMKTVHLAAPGEKVLTTAPGNKYEVQSGTVLAAAHVAGALAIASSKFHGRYQSVEILKALLSEGGGDRVENLMFETLSGNRLNIAKFLKILD